MNRVDNLSAQSASRQPMSDAPGPKGTLIQGVMREFNRDSLSFIRRCQSYGDVVRMRFLYLTVHFIYHPDYIEYVLSTKLH